MSLDPEYVRQMGFATDRAKRARGHISHVRWSGGHLDVTIEPNRKAEQVEPVEQPSRRGLVGQGRLI